MESKWKECVDKGDMDTAQKEIIEHIKSKSEQTIEEFFYYVIKNIKKDIKNTKLQKLLYGALYFYFSEKGKTIPPQYKGDFGEPLQTKNNPLIKLVSLYAYGMFDVVFKKDGDIFQTSVIDRKIKKYEPINRPYDKFIVELLKKSTMAPVYGNSRILYIGITTDKNDRDEWYVGQTSQTWELRHCTITSKYPSHCIDTGLALFGFTRSLELDGKTSALQTCDMKYAENGRHSTRFYLLWGVGDSDVIKQTLETCESYFIESLEDFTIKNDLVRILTDHDIEFAGRYKKSKEHRLSLMRFNSLNGRYEEKLVPSEIKTLNKTFGTEFDENKLIMGIDKTKIIQSPKKETVKKEGSVLTQKEFAERLMQIIGKTKYAAEKHQLYKQWKIAKDLFKKGDKSKEQAVQEYQALLSDKNKFEAYMNGSLIIEDESIISLKNKIFK